MDYQPFLIANYQTGLEEDLQPWVLPEDAFTIAQNAYIYRGVVRKREGYQLINKFPAAQTTITNISQANPGVVTVTSAAGLANGQNFQITGVTGMTQVNGNTYQIGGLAGTTFNLLTTAGANVNTTGFGAYGGGGTLSLFPGNSIVGLASYVTSSGVKQLIAFDTRRAAQYTKSLQAFTPIGTADVFTGTASDFFHWVNYRTSGTSTSPLLYVTNNVDQVYTYDGTNLAALTITINGSGHTVTRCRFLFTLRQRLILLSTLENGSSFLQRARWCQADNPTSWRDDVPGQGGYVDCPTTEQIVAADALQDAIVVYFTNSVWTLRPTTDPALPFRWDRVNSHRFTKAPYGAIGYDSVVLGIGDPGIYASNTREVTRIDQKIPDFVNRVDHSNFSKIYAARNQKLDQGWWLYPSGATTSSDKALIYNDQGASWSIYDMPMNCLGNAQTGLDPVWSDYDGSTLPELLWEQFNDETWIGLAFQEDVQIFVGGDISGNIFELNADGDDNGAAINFVLQTASLNPYKSQGSRARLGYIDVRFRSEFDTVVNFEFYTESSVDPYLVTSTDLLPSREYIGEVENITQANPATVTSSNHGLQTGDVIYLYNVKGMTQINNQPLTVTRVNSNLFQVNDNSTGYSAYTGGGLIVTQPYTELKVWKRIYAGGVGHAHKVRITNNAKDQPIRIDGMIWWFKPHGKRMIQ